MKSIKTKLLLSISVMILSVTIFVGLISLGIAYQSLKSESEKALKLLAKEGAKVTESRMDSLVQTLNIIAKRSEIINTGWTVNLAVLKEELKKTDFLDIGYILPNGYTYYSDGTVRLSSDVIYVKQALKGETVISDIMFSRVTRKPEIMICVPVKKDGKVVGALIGRKEADTLSNITKDTSYGKNGFAYMINSRGNIIAHPDEQKVLSKYNPIELSKKDKKLSTLSNAFATMLNKQTGTVSYKNQGKKLYSGYAKINQSSWIFVITADESEVLDAVGQLIRSILIVMSIIFIIGMIFVVFLGNSIAKPIIHMAKHSEKMSELSIIENIPEKYLNGKDEVAILAKAFQNLTVNLREIVKQIAVSTNSVSETTQYLSSATKKSADVSKEITVAVEDIAMGASNQADSTEIGLQNADLLGQKIEKNNDLLSTLNTSSNKVTEIVKDGLKEVDLLSKVSRENNKAAREINEIIQKTKLSAENIGEASKVIAEMASQTNLLSLNAAIEASRAGEAGAGFAVVAEEIKKMAEQSAESTRHIDSIVKELQSNVKRAVGSMDSIISISMQQENSVGITIQNYQLISKSMEESEIAIDEINTSAGEMKAAKDQILNLLQDLSAVAQENAASTNEVSSAVDGQTEAVKEIALATEKVEELSTSLNEIIIRFQV